MIHALSVSNFKSLREMTTGLEPFTVFVGPNASGKSSVLQALNFISRTYWAEHPKQMEGEIAQGLSRGASEPIEFIATTESRRYRYQTRGLGAGPPLGSAKWNGRGRGTTADLISEDWKEWKWSPSNPTPLPLSVLLRLESSKLVPPSPASDPTIMSADGTGVHSALASMALSDPDTWQQLQTDLRRIIPTIRRLRHTPTRPGQPPALLFDALGADSLPAHQVSEGTLLVLGLLTALHAPDRPQLVLLDDLDRGLHPKAQKELIALLRGLMETNPHLQIVATTHSPYMLDCMEVDEVRMTLLRDDGSTACAPLTSHPQFPKWKDEMTPGEMWSLFGEKWVAEQEVSV